MDYVDCCACKGRKKVVGLGGFEKNCDTCKGVGYIEQTKLTASKVISAALQELDQSNPTFKIISGFAIPINQAHSTEEERKAELDALIDLAAKEDKIRRKKSKKKASKKKHVTSRLRKPL